MLACVRDRRGPLPGAAHRWLRRGVPRRIVQHAPDVPPRPVRTTERLVAVGAEERPAFVGGEQHRLVEARQVEQGPGRHHGSGRHRHHDGGRQRVAAAAPGAPDHDPAQRHQQCQLTARQRRQPDQHTGGQRGPAISGRAEQDHQDRRGEERRQALRHHQPVVHPQVRCRGGQTRSHQPHRVATHPLAEHADERHHRHADQHRSEPLERHRIVRPSTDPGERRQHDRRQRTMLGTGMVGHDLPEPDALGELPGLRAVVDRVVQQQRLIPLPPHQPHEAEHRSDPGDDRQPDPERRTPIGAHGDRVCHPRTRSRATSLAPRRHGQVLGATSRHFPDHDEIGGLGDVGGWAGSAVNVNGRRGGG